MLVVFVVALGVRTAAAVAIPDGTDCECPVGMPIRDGVGGDGVHYLYAGRALSDGRGFVAPFAPQETPYAHQAPLWTIVVAGTDEIGLTEVPQKKLLFAFLGAGTAVLVGVAARQVASRRASIVAASIAAVYPGLWLYERNLNAETLAFPLIAAVVILTYRYRRRPGWAAALALGAAVGVLCLARSEQVLIIPFVLIPVLLSTPAVKWGTRIARVAACGAVIVALLAPWSIYNLGRFERPVLLSTGFGYTALAGACDSTFAGDHLGSFDSMECILASPAAYEPDASLADGLMRQAALDYTVDHLDRLPVVVLAREGRSWGVFEPAQQVRFNARLLNAPTAASWAQVATYWITLTLALGGAVILRRRRVPIYPLLAFPAIVVLTTALTFGDSRYRATAEISFIIFAAVALDAAWSMLRARTTRGSPSGASAPEAGSPDSTAATAADADAGAGPPAVRTRSAERAR
jgi:hypothetical protein